MSANYKAPIAKFKLAPLTKKAILERSFGQITTRSNGINDDDYDKRFGSIFDYRIFGLSKDRLQDPRYSLIVKSLKNCDSLTLDNIGHITLPIPLIPSGYSVSNRAYMRLVLGVKSNSIVKGLIEGDYILCVPKKGQPLDETQALYDSYVSKDSEEFKRLVKNKLIHFSCIDNAHNSSKENENYRYYYKTHLFAVHRTLLSGLSRSSIYNYDNLHRDFTLLSNSLAIVELMSYIDVNNELEYLRLQLASINHKLSEEIDKSLPEKDIDIQAYIANMKDSEAVYSNSTISKLQAALQKCQKRFKFMRGFKLNNIHPIELVTDVIPVIPVGYRDRRPVFDGDSIKFTDDCINSYYDRFLEFSEKYRSLVIDIPDYMDIFNYEKLSPTQQQILANCLDDYPIQDNTLNSLYKDIQEDLNWFSRKTNSLDDSSPKTERSPADRLVGKTADIRGKGIGKRTDRCARAVITPDRYIPLDYIGVPYDILIVEYGKQIRKALRSKGYHVTEKDLLNLNKCQTTSITFSPDDKIKDGTVETNFNTQADNSKTKLSLQAAVHKILQGIIKNVRVMPIRFPSLHKYSDAGAKIIIVYDYTLHLHPLQCPGLNADFDGDQMTIKFIETPSAVAETDELLLPSKNSFSFTGTPMHCPTQDAVLGFYFLTRKSEDTTIKGYFSSLEEMLGYYQRDLIDLEDTVSVLLPDYTHSKFNEYYLQEYRETHEEDGFATSTHVYQELNTNPSNFAIKSFNPRYTKDMGMVTSTVGRFIANMYIPQNLGFVDRTKPENKYLLEVDTLVDKIPKTKSLISKIIGKVDQTQHTPVASYVKDHIKDLGYHYITVVGSTIGFLDIKPAPHREELIDSCKERIAIVEKAIETKEEVNTDNAIWSDVSVRYKSQVKSILANTSLDDHSKILSCKLALTTDTCEKIQKDIHDSLDRNNTYRAMVETGSRGSMLQLQQIAGMRGMLTNPDGTLRDEPVWGCFYNGLNPTEIMNSSYSSRKGMMDRGNKTKDTGNLTRNLKYAMQDQIITKADCGNTEGTLISDYWVTPPKTEEEELDKDFRKDNYRPMVVRARGMFVCKDVIDKVTGEVLFKRNEPIYYFPTKEQQERIDKLQEQYGKEGILIRTPSTCKCIKGKCIKCYGYYAGAGRYPRIGEAIGVSTSQSMGEIFTQAVMVNFHTGGVAGGDSNDKCDDIINAIILGKLNEITTKLLPTLRLIRTTDVEKTINVVKETLYKYVAESGVTDIQDLFNNVLETKDGIPLTMNSFGMVANEIYNAIVEEVVKTIESSYTAAGIQFSVTSYYLLASSMASLVEIVDPGESSYCVGELKPMREIINANMICALKDESPIIVKPSFSNLKRLPLSSDSPLSAICFQNPMYTMTYGMLEAKEDNLTNPITVFATGNHLMTGEGFVTIKDRVTPKKSYQTFNEILDMPIEYSTPFVAVEDPTGIDVDKGSITDTIKDMSKHVKFSNDDDDIEDEFEDENDLFQDGDVGEVNLYEDDNLKIDLGDDIDLGILSNEDMPEGNITNDDDTDLDDLDMEDINIDDIFDDDNPSDVDIQDQPTGSSPKKHAAW